jgi:hypothetical protein
MADTPRLNGNWSLMLHEVTDRASVVCEMWDNAIVNHVAVHNTPRLKDGAKAVEKALWAFQQLATEVECQHDDG